MPRARMPGRQGVPVVIPCYRVPFLTRARRLLGDLWAFLKRPTFF